MHLFVVPEDGDALLGMPDIELLNILQINCNTIDTVKEENAFNPGREQCKHRPCKGLWKEGQQ